MRSPFFWGGALCGVSVGVWSVGVCVVGGVSGWVGESAWGFWWLGCAAFGGASRPLGRRRCEVSEGVRVWWVAGVWARALWAEAGVRLPVRVACVGRFVEGVEFGARWLLVGPRGRLVGAPSCEVRVAGSVVEWERAWKSAGGLWPPAFVPA